MVADGVAAAQRDVGEGTHVVRGALDGHQVGAEVATGDELVALEAAPDLPAEPPLVEVGEARAVVGEDVDHRVLLGERDEPVPVARAQHTHLLAGPQHSGSLAPAPWRRRRETSMAHAPTSVAHVTIRVALEHRTTYPFDRPVTVHPHMVRLRPAPHCRTPIEAYSLTVEPRGHFLNWQQDPFGNYLARLVFPEQVSELDIVVDLVADMTVVNPFDFFVEDYAERYPFSYEADLAADLEPYLRRSTSRPATAPDRSSGSGSPTAAWPDARDRIVDFLVAVNQAAAARRRYTVRMEHGVQTPDETLREPAGVLPRQRLAAGRGPARARPGGAVRLRLPRPAGRRRRADRRPVGPEPRTSPTCTPGPRSTSPARAGSGSTRRPGCSPARGTSRSARPRTPPPPRRSAARPAPREVSFDFPNTVTRIHEDARVTRPYTEEQWAGVDPLGEHVDALLRDGDVRLTMGGEPTFVSADDMDRRSGTSTPTARDKRVLAATSPSGWRPAGRPAASCTTARASGIRASRCRAGRPSHVARRRRAAVARPDLLDRPVGRARGGRRHRAGRAGGGRRAQPGGPARRPGRRTSLAAYEDPFAQLLDEARRPVGDPVDPDACPPWPRRTPRHRRHLARLGACRCFDAATPHRRPAGAPPAGGCAAVTCSWSRATPPPACGCRSTRSPGARRRPCPTARRSPRAGPRRPETGVGARRGARRRGGAAHAVTVEERDGHLFVFLPPLDRAGAGAGARRRGRGRAAEARRPGGPRGLPAARRPALVQPVGHPRPRRHRGQRPAHAQLGGAARPDRRPSTRTPARSGWPPRSSTFDGTHTGTGGGNHLTLGGPTPADSPLLRRPDLLRSLVTYWQHHPSLSYVFSGRFIGPTSQAPRVDEGRHETLYELEIAFAELERATREDGETAAVARRPPAAAPAHRRHRQHAPRRVLHRQALQPRQRPRPARPARAARLRDAAAPADGARAGRCSCARSSPGSGPSPTPARSCAGAPRCTTVPAARLRDGRPRGRRARDLRASATARVRPGLARAVPGVPLPAPGRGRRRRRAPRAARCGRAVARPRRGGRRWRHVALRRLLASSGSR